jgi:hypothetical protein
MSLKLFHVVFITVSVGLALFVAVWAVQDARWVLAAGALAAGAALLVYRGLFLRKAREIGLR